MKCIICDAETRVLATRGDRRTRLCDNNHRRITVEVDWTVMRSIHGYDHKIIERIRAGVKRRTKAEERREQVLMMRREGVLVKVIAHRLSMGERQVYNILKEFGEYGSQRGVHWPRGPASLHHSTESLLKVP